MCGEELAEKALLSSKAIQKMETGKSGMYVDTFIRIAGALNVSLDILAGIGEMEKQKKISQEAFYIVCYDKSPTEIQYALEIVETIFWLKANYPD